jgi:uncharacterized protein YggE
MQAVTSSLQDEGIDEDEISTARFNVHPVYENIQDRQTGRHSQVLSGYRVSNNLVVETGNLDRVATIIDTAVNAGANRVDGVHFMLSPELMAELKDSLIESAVLNARSKAEKALAPLDYKITGVMSISLSEHYPSPLPRAESARMAMASSMPTQVFAPDQDVRANVQVTFLIGEISDGNDKG